MLNELDVTTPSGADEVRGRPELYLHPSPAQGALGLVERTLRHVLDDEERHVHRAEVLLYQDHVTIVDDGVELPVDVVAVDGVAHPLLYLGFLTFHGGPGILGWAPTLNALSQTLVVETVSEHRVYRATFARGGLVDLLHEAPDPRGLTLGLRLTFRPDPVVFGDAPLMPLDVARVVRSGREQHRTVSRAGKPRAVLFRDRSTEACPFVEL